MHVEDCDVQLKTGFATSLQGTDTYGFLCSISLWIKTFSQGRKRCISWKGINVGIG